MKGWICLVFVACFAAAPAWATEQFKDDTLLAISVQIPNYSGTERYRPPFVAIWLETLDGEAETTIEVWYNRPHWLPDLSQWWRKIGSAGSQNYDAITGATQRPGNYLVEWDGTDVSGTPVTAGEYWLWVEIAREHGSTERVRVKIDLNQPGSGGKAQGSSEVGLVQALVI